MSPGRSSVRGARTDLYRAVWCELYELEPDETITIPELLKRIQRAHPAKVIYTTTLQRALLRAEEAHLVRREPRPNRHRRSVWSRVKWGEVVTVHSLAGDATDPRLVVDVLEALRSARYLVRDSRGYKKAV